MAFLPLFTLLFLTLLLPLHSLSQTSTTTTATTLSLLMAIKSSLDPRGLILSSWSPNATDPCNASFEGIACNEHGEVVNITLQGRGLSGQIPPEIGHLKSLLGLYLHFNRLHGVVPPELANLTSLSDLYLNVNDLSGDIPPQIGDMSNLQGQFFFLIQAPIFLAFYHILVWLHEGLSLEERWNLCLCLYPAMVKIEFDQKMLTNKAKSYKLFS